jgi:wobble nucleotide-excising tRNase
MRAGIEGRVPAGVGFDAYVALAANPDVDGKIATKEKELEAVQQAAQLRARAALSEVTLPVSPADFETLLGRTITDLSGEAELRVAEHLAAHEMEKTGERWIQEGLGYIRADACPLCDQPLKDVALIGTYSAFFGAAYNDLKDAIAYHRNMLSTLFG